jgi:hypothetical protein
MPSAGFKPAIERPQNYASDRRAPGIGSVAQLAQSIAYILAVEDRHTGSVVHRADTDRCQDVLILHL